MSERSDAIHRIAEELGLVIGQLDNFPDDADTDGYHYLLGKRKGLLAAFNAIVGQP